MNRLFEISIGLLGCFIFLFASPSFLEAFGGYLEPRISLKENYSDNFLLDPDLKKAVFWTTISPGLKLQLSGGQIDVSGDIAADINRFLDDSDLNTSDYFFSLLPRYKIEGGSLQLSLSLKRDTTLQDELIEIGRILNRVKRMLLVFHPSGEFSVTKRTSIGFEYRLRMADYSEAESLGLFDYKDQVGVASLLHQTTERSQVSLSLSYSFYRVPNQGTSENTVNALVGITHDFSDTTQGTFFTGAYQNTKRGMNDRREGFLLSGGLNKKFEQTKIRANLDRRVLPSGSGSLFLRDHFSLFVRRQFMTDLDGSLSLNLYESRNITDLNTGKSTYNQMASALHWFWTDQWFLSVSYSYAWAKNEGGTRTRKNTGFLMLKYQWSKSIFSFQVIDSSFSQKKGR